MSYEQLCIIVAAILLAPRLSLRAALGLSTLCAVLSVIAMVMAMVRT